MDDAKPDQPTIQWKAVVDRIESTTAVILVGEDEEQVLIPTQLLPKGVREGSHLIAEWQLDPQGETEAKDRVQGLLKQLLQRPKPSDPSNES